MGQSRTGREVDQRGQHELAVNVRHSSGPYACTKPFYRVPARQLLKGSTVARDIQLPTCLDIAR